MKCDSCPTPKSCEAATTTIPACKAKNAVVSFDAPGNLLEVARTLEARVAELERGRQ